MLQKDGTHFMVEPIFLHSEDGGRCNGSALSEQEIVARLSLEQASLERPAGEHTWRQAAVLIPLLCQENAWHLLYTRRTDQVPHHKGQISFPGGAFEAGDRSLVETALRESREEIGLAASDVRILGQLAGLQTVSDFIVTPVVGRITRPFTMKLSPFEVSRVFTIPLAWLADARHREVRPYPRGDGSVLDVIYYDKFEDELLWGVTAYITVLFLQALGLTE